MDESRLMAAPVIVNDSMNNSECKKTCYWPLDTVLNKKSLYIYLSNIEAQKLGFKVNNKSLYYYNIIPKKKRFEHTTINWNGSDDRITNFEFILLYNTDTACTRYRWGHSFYREVDTLVPIIIDSLPSKIFWFDPHPKLFNALPERYANLKNVFQQLTCAKQKNPDHQFDNHWSKARNIVLNKINYLELPNETFIKFGFKMNQDSVCINHPLYNRIIH